MELDFEPLKKKKNLLAFSAGVDSSALFFLMQEAGVDFDLAMVDYGVRVQSKAEVIYAQKLAKKYVKKLYLHHAPKIKNNFEHNARVVRYDFFDSIVLENGYEYLITAHQLDDRFEWFMMQLSRGAGLNELIGFEKYTKRKNYTIYRPLLEITKEKLLHYLEKNRYQYFCDHTNSDEKYKRNYFRNHFCAKFLNEFSEGVKRSLEYLHNDKAFIANSFELLYEKKDLIIYRMDKAPKEYLCVKRLKELGYVMSAKQRKEVTQNSDLVIGGEFAIGSCQNLLFIAPFCKVTMDKKFKEQCRIAQIPKHIRPYLASGDFDIEFIKNLILQHTKAQL